MAKHPLIRTIYLYLFALVGLILVVIGAVRLLDLGMKIFIFKAADQSQTYMQQPPYPPYGVETKPVKNSTQAEVSIKKTVNLTQEEKDALDQWLASYQSWQEGQAKIDYLKSSREREASNSLAFIIIGLPLYFYHWSVIKRDKKKEHASA